WGSCRRGDVSQDGALQAQPPERRLTRRQPASWKAGERRPLSHRACPGGRTEPFAPAFTPLVAAPLEPRALRSRARGSREQEARVATHARSTAGGCCVCVSRRFRTGRKVDPPPPICILRESRSGREDLSALSSFLWCRRADCLGHTVRHCHATFSTRRE